MIALTQTLVLALAALQASQVTPPREGLTADLERRIAGLVSVETGKPARRQDEAPAPTPEPMKQDPLGSASSGFIDFDWMEMDARVGVSVFSEEYHIDPSPRIGVVARAPLTWPAPSDNPDGDYFGLFAQLDVTLIERTIKPSVDKPSGGMISATLGLDFAILRNATWLLLIRGGFQYATYGGVTDLVDGFAPMAGITFGLTVSRSLSLTLSPEYVQGDGDSIASGLLGLTFDF